MKELGPHIAYGLAQLANVVRDIAGLGVLSPDQMQALRVGAEALDTLIRNVGDQDHVPLDLPTSLTMMIDAHQHAYGDELIAYAAGKGMFEKVPGMPRSIKLGYVAIDDIAKAAAWMALDRSGGNPAQAVLLTHRLQESAVFHVSTAATSAVFASQRMGEPQGSA